MLLRLRRVNVFSRLRSLHSFSTQTGESDETGDAFYEDEASAFLSTAMRRSPRSAVREETEAEPEPEPEPVPLMDRPPVFPEREDESAVDREIHAHNSSLYNLKQQAILGRVVAVGKKEVLVDLGWKDYQTFFKSELSLSQIYRADQQSDQTDHPQALRPGDELRFRIEEIGTPHGEMFVSTQKMRADIRRQLVWEELKKAFREEGLVTGRVLNPCNAGYAIGIAGFVAFCPLTRISPTVARKVGVLQPFRITFMTDSVGRNLVVADARVMKVGRPWNM